MKFWPLALVRVAQSTSCLNRIFRRDFENETKCLKMPRPDYMCSYTCSCRNKSTVKGIIPDKPQSHYNYGIVKVCITFMIGITIGGYISKSMANLLEDHQVFVFDEDRDEHEDNVEPKDWEANSSVILSNVVRLPFICDNNVDFLIYT